MDIRVIIKLHELLMAGSAGNSEYLSKRLGISVRTVYNYVTFMKNELNAPIIYNSNNKCYSYDGVCELCFIG
ncbi:HTH domain-containing protein [Flavobacterium luteum]|uniref:HTH domain-containing protein n=1 Tax=Flavobacterium luteum TaxID=2026654 RepID=A0A7J5A820_9FLAO|nr:HTH domain-containing protein [Flavobacterium luteum]